MRRGVALAGVVVLALAVSLTAGCAKHYIPNTEIEDTDENREVIDFCERYRHAVEDLNVGLLLSLASPRYFDNSGTASSDDDLDRAGLEKVLKERFESVETVRFEVRYRDLYESHGVVYVVYTYTTSFQYLVEGEPQWANRTADNRLELERVDDGFLILTGM